MFQITEVMIHGFHTVSKPCFLQCCLVLKSLRQPISNYCFIFVSFQTGSCYVCDEVFTILLLQFPNSWDYRLYTVTAPGCILWDSSIILT